MCAQSLAWPCHLKRGLSPVELGEPTLHRTSLRLSILHRDPLPQFVLCLFSLTQKHLSLPALGPAQTPLRCCETVIRVSGCVPALDLTPVDWNMHEGLLPAYPVHFLPTPGEHLLWIIVGLLLIAECIKLNNSFISSCDSEMVARETTGNMFNL